MPLFIKAIGFRIIAILFTSLFTGISTSITLNIGLFFIYYFYDILWHKFKVSNFLKKLVVRMGLLPPSFLPLVKGQVASRATGG